MVVGISELKSYFENKKLDGNSYLVKTSGGRFNNEIRFEIFLVEENTMTEQPVVHGRYFAGEGYYRPWLEVHYNETVRLNSDNLSLMEEGLDEKLFKHLSDLLPPASHIMVFYSNYPETEKSLSVGVPPSATYIGYLLFMAGCTWFKDWYFPEGFMEGGVKLQGNKSLNNSHRRKALGKLKSELLQFLNKEGETGSFLDDEKRAKKVLDYIENELKNSDEV